MDMAPWNLLCLLLCQACFTVNGIAKESLFSNRQRRSTSDAECKHNGVRVDSKSGSICLCPTGYNGTTCEAEMQVHAITMLSDLNVQNGGVISCKLDKNVCLLHINVYAANNEAKAKDTIKIKMKSHTASSDIRLLVLSAANIVTYQFDQLQLLSIPVYIQSVHGKSGNVTFNVLQDNKIVASVSYKLEFVEKAFTTAPAFSEHGNILSDSRLVCEDFCRFLLLTTPLPDNTCRQVDSLCGSTWSFPTLYSGSTCYTEIVFESDSCQKLCFNVRDTADTLCYWRFPSVDQSTASCGCDPLCSNATIEDVCCPQNRTMKVCPNPEGGVKPWVVGTGVGVSLAAIGAVVTIGWCLHYKVLSRNKVEDFSAESSKVNGVKGKNVDRKETRTAEKHRKPPDTKRWKTKKGAKQ